MSVASGVLVRGACPGGQGLAGRTVPGVVPCAEPGVVPCPLAGLVVDAPGVDGVGVLGVVEVLEAGPGVRMELLAWGNTVMEPHLFRIAPQSGSGESYTHEGEEFLYILQGELQISLEEEEYRLQPGDSFYFESATPHRWTNPGRDETWVLWVNTPPTF